MLKAGPGWYRLSVVGACFLILALTAAPAAVRADVSALPRPTGIVGGFEVEPCAWPSAVFFTDDESDCSGVYVGGKIVLTAAHCLKDTYRIDIDCQNDADCPNVDAFGNQLTLTCNQADCPTCPPQCSNDTSSVARGDSIRILFGERYPNRNDDHPRRTIPLQYCRQRGFGDKPTFDFGYCVLSEEPAVQAVPMMMHCEADQFLGQGTPVVAVAFGNEDFDDMPPAHGSEHFLRNTLRFDGDATVGVSLTDWVGKSPGAGVAPGDAGSPLFIRLPDETWRVVGVASTNAPSYETVWTNVAWMLEDPNVAAEQNKLIPCHVLWSDSPHEIVRFLPLQGQESKEGVPVADLRGRSPGHTFSMHQAAVTDDPHWSRIVVLVGVPGATDVSFAR